LRAYWPLVFAISTVVAGRIGNQVRAGFSPYESRYLVAVLLVFILASVLAPFTVFVPKLIRMKEAVAFDYAMLAHALGEQFEYKWLSQRKRIQAAVLDTPDFSATIDLFSTVANSQQTAWFPVSFEAIRQLTLVAILPIAALAICVLPFDVILQHVAKLLF
jgi:hypothetical protein